MTLLSARGFSVLNISANLGISETTVRTYLRSIYAKIGVSNRAELARRLASQPSDAAPRPFGR